MLSDLRLMLAEQREYRELLLTVTRRDLLVRYKQSVMGFGWAILVPTLNMLIFTMIFTRVAPLDTGVPYPIYAYTGLLPWGMFAASLRFATTSLTANTSLVTKVYFPREVFPFSAVLVSLVDFAVASTVLVVLMAVYGIGTSWTIAFLPVVLVVQILFTAGVGLLLAMGNLFFRDVRYLFEVTIIVWMFATSVVYPVDQIGGRLGAVLAVNPMTPIIDAYRSIILRGELPGTPFAVAAVIAATVFVSCWLAFHRTEYRFAESI